MSKPRFEIGDRVMCPAVGAATVCWVEDGTVTVRVDGKPAEEDMYWFFADELELIIDDEETLI